MADRRREGGLEPVWSCIVLSVTGAVSPLHLPNIRASAVLRYCIVFEWTAKQPHFICLHIATELTAAYVLGLYWEFIVLFLGRTLISVMWRMGQIYSLKIPLVSSKGYFGFGAWTSINSHWCEGWSPGEDLFLPSVLLVYLWRVACQNCNTELMLSLCLKRWGLGQVDRRSWQLPLLPSPGAWWLFSSSRSQTGGWNSDLLGQLYSYSSLVASYLLTSLGVWEDCCCLCAWRCWIQSAVVLFVACSLRKTTATAEVRLRQKAH